ncbi:MAG: hypothetical protein MHM6MM_006512 [Cercozoa sp. M6MM]
MSSFRKYYYRGVESKDLPAVSHRDLVKMVHSRVRRKFTRGLGEDCLKLLKRIRKAAKEATPGEKPKLVKTHLRNMVVMPEMIGAQLGIYNGRGFVYVEVKPDMCGRYLGEFAITYKPTSQRRGTAIGDVTYVAL